MLALQQPAVRRVLHVSALLLILLLAAYLRLTNIAVNPGWYADEGTHLDIARHLLNGEIRYLAVNRSFLLFARLPLFELTLTAAVSLFGLSMNTLRVLCALFEIAALFLLYFTARLIKPGEKSFALLAALALAVYPQAVLYSRFGFSYHLLSPLMIIICLCLTLYFRTATRRLLAVAALLTGLGLISDLIMGAVLLPLALIVLRKRASDLLWSLPLAALPFIMFATVMLLHDASTFIFDLHYTLSRLGGLSLTTQLYNIALNYTVLLSQDFWFPLGIIGLFLLTPGYFRAVSLLLLFAPIVITGRTVAFYSLSAYYTIPLLPLVALGTASFVYYAVRHLWSESLLPSAQTMGLIVCVIALPFGVSLLLSLNSIHTGFPTSIDPFLLDTDAAQRTAHYLNERLSPDDRIIASPGLAWMLNGDVADFQMSVAALGEQAVHLPANLPADRFIFDPRPASAHYIVVDNLWLNWGVVHMPAVHQILSDLESWPVIYQDGSFTVYHNPALSPQ